ncbi:MAG: ErfK/YbiS/YcfS/YnhG family protein [Bacteroidetes bacterium OLB11]|nr:MAG: ErfK/YbiS/YcfS/YnhG family protein [Bacteroidetes bacterium OLB11]
MWSATEIFKLAIKNNNIHEAFETMRPQHTWYKHFRNEYQSLSQRNMQLTSFEGLKDSITIGDSSFAIYQLRKKLYAETKLPIDTHLMIWNQEALDGLKKYQYINNIKATGKIDSITINKLKSNTNEKLKQLALNMERMRWLKHDFQQPFVWVAIPQMVLFYFGNDSIEFTMNVVVGRPSRPTPGIDSKIENIVFSPPWVVPPTIMREEVVPGIARRGGSYLARRGLRAYDRRGKVVPPSAINSGNFRNFLISQAPGYNSSLGEVKFNMPNPWSIYMHDTPHREDFVKANRALSSGCVRLQKPKDFASFVLKDTAQYSRRQVDSICKLRKTIFVPVKQNIDVHFVYLTNAVDSIGNVLYLKDIYKWD